MRAKRRFEVSVDTRTKGRRLDGYTVRRIDGHEVLLDPDLLKLQVELTITTGGIFGRGLSATVDGLNGARLPDRTGLRRRLKLPLPRIGRRGSIRRMEPTETMPAVEPGRAAALAADAAADRDLSPAASASLERAIERLPEAHAKSDDEAQAAGK